MVDGVVLDDIKKLSRECEPGEQGEISGFLLYFGTLIGRLKQINFRHIN